MTIDPNNVYELMGLVVALVILYLYFLPATIARKRMHRNATAILVMNIFLGWTFLGWVMALVWANTND